MDNLLLVLSQLGVSGVGSVLLLFAALLFSCFFRFIAVLSIFRWGLGIRGWSFGFVTMGLALALSYYVMVPQIDQSVGAASAVLGKGPNPTEELRQNAFAAATDSWKLFLIKNTDSSTLKNFNAVKDAADTAPSWRVVAPAFVISELRHGTKAALSIILPFLVVDVLLALLFTGLGVENLKVAVVAVPVKLLLLVAVDGWNLVAQGLIKVYG